MIGKNLGAIRDFCFIFAPYCAVLIVSPAFGKQTNKQMKDFRIERMVHLIRLRDLQIHQ